MRETMNIGEAGKRIARNVRRLREQRKMTLVELSNRLYVAGQPIPITGLRRLERCERRVDVDEVVAIAGILNVPADRLAFDDSLVSDAA